jgi:hypothetical protein
LTFEQKYEMIFAVMRDKMIKLRGPNGTTKEITLDEWNSYTPLNRHAQRVAALSHTLKEWKEAAEARENAFNGGHDDLAGHCDGPED